jgi:nicotinate phosphoribosyltransferase
MNKMGTSLKNPSYDMSEMLTEFDLAPGWYEEFCIKYGSPNTALLTDFYQLTMNAAYLDNNKDDTATFDLFIRGLPKDWGYFIANGIEDAIDYATHIKFSDGDISYLRKQGIFKEEYLQALKDFRFEGDMYTVKEGTPIFPNEPIMRITAKRSQVQFLESTLLNIINHQTLIASKASRVVNAAGNARVVDFGLRRAQGEDAAIKGARASYIAGAAATSNVLAGKKYNIPISGTHAHSFVMSFESEIAAFRAYVKTFPEQATLLIDTYNTISGAKNAARVAKELEKKGHKLGAVRLDSGNIAAQSIQVRKILDADGLEYVKIIASNDLNEYKIENMRVQGARIDGYGVGTEMITAKPIAAISGVYKLVEDQDGPKIKLSEGKQTLPGIKQIYRMMGSDEKYSHDVIALEGESVAGIPLLEKVVSKGKRVISSPSLEQIRSYSLNEVAKLNSNLFKTNVNSPYEIVLSKKLEDTIVALSKKYSLADGNYGLAEGNYGLAEGNYGLADGNYGLADENNCTDYSASSISAANIL